MGYQKCLLHLDQNQKEVVSHGDASFPCAGYDYLYAPPHAVPWHWHDEFEFLFVERGKMTLEVPSATMLLSSGEGAFVNSAVLHSVVPNEESRLQSLVFSPLLVTGWEESALSIRYIRPLTDSSLSSARFGPSETEDFKRAFSAMGREESGYEFAVRSSLSSLLLALSLHLPEGKKGEGRRDDLRLKQMVGLIQARYGEELTLEEIAASAGIGERECLRCFRRTMHLSPVQYLLKYRIDKASSMLLEKKAMNVSDVALACGFDSPGYFTKMFVRLRGKTPTAYRQSPSSLEKGDPF